MKCFTIVKLETFQVLLKPFYWVFFKLQVETIHEHKINKIWILPGDICRFRMLSESNPVCSIISCFILSFNSFSFEPTLPSNSFVNLNWIFVKSVPSFNDFDGAGVVDDTSGRDDVLVDAVAEKYIKNFTDDYCVFFIKNMITMLSWQVYMLTAFGK